MQKESIPTGNTPTVRANPAEASQPTVINRPLQGRALLIARSIWVAVTILAVTLFVIAIPARINLLLHPAPELRSLLAEISLPVAVYALLIAGREIVFAATFTMIGAIIFWRRSDSGPAIFASTVMIAFASSFFAAYRLVFADVSPLLYTLSRLVLMIGFGGAPILIYTFPDGQFVPRWTRFAAIAWLAVVVLQFPTHEGLFVYVAGQRRILPTTLALYAFFLLIAVYAQVYRFRRYADKAGRQQTKWVMLGFATGIFALILWYTSVLLFPLADSPTAVRMLRVLIGETLYLFGFIAIPLSIAFSILRYRLYDINLFINRGLVYGSLTVILVTAFTATLFLLKAALEAILDGSQSTTAAIIATAVVVALFAPTRRRIQQFIDVRFFARTANPAKAATAPSSIGRHPGALTGKQIGPYLIDNVIGRGGMGEVYHGVHAALSREVAVKVLSPESAQEAEMKTRFEREARIIAGIRHPNIVTVYDYGEYEGQFYMAMEFLDGELLYHKLRSAPFDLDTTLLILRDIAAALDTAHARGLVHRDVKPSNIVLVKPDGEGEGRAVLMDFGIAKMMEGATGITHSGMLGTVDYIAPEQILHAGEVDKGADIYALGVIAYQMLTGKLPFAGANPGQQLYAHLQQSPKDPREIKPDIPLEAANAVLRALKKSPAERQTTAGDLVAEMAAKQDK